LDVDGYDFPLQFWVQAVAHGLRVDEIPVPRIYVDLNRSFGSELDDPTRRLALYRATFERELARCAGRLRLITGSGA
jgi:dolichol-phosphate mannosyltransferase